MSLLLAVVAFAPSAHAMKIKGRNKGYMHLLNPVWTEAKDPGKHGYSFREPVTTVPARFRKLYPDISKEICIIATGVEAAKKDKILIRVGGGRTTPVSIVVAPGTELQFKNTDAFTHRLFGVDVNTFSESETVKGGLRTWAVPAGVGSYEIRDGAAPSLRMWVVSEPNVAAISYPSKKGLFVLSVAQPGDYNVQAYFAGKKVGESMDVTVRRRDIDISRKPFIVATKAKKKAKK